MLQLRGHDSPPRPEQRLKAVVKNCAIEGTASLQTVNLPDLATGIIERLCALIRVPDFKFDTGREVVPRIPPLSVFIGE
jgi:hypothetical protein